MHFLKLRHASFKNALSGIIWTLTTQINFRVHIILSLVVIIFGLLLKVTKMEMILIILIIFIGLSIELANTSIEALTDLVTKEWRHEAKYAKDVAAGMMLLFAAGAVILAGLIFIPRLLLFF